MVNRVSRFSPKGGHSAAQTVLKIIYMNTRKMKGKRNSDTRNRQQRTTTDFINMTELYSTIEHYTDLLCCFTASFSAVSRAEIFDYLNIFH